MFKFNNKTWRTFNYTRALVWTITVPISYFAGWVYSVAFVAVCSLYANIASDLAAARADSDQEQLDRIEEMLKKLLKSNEGGADR